MSRPVAILHVLLTFAAVAYTVSSARAASSANAPRAFGSAGVREDVSANVPDQWWSAVQSDILQSEYHITGERVGAPAVHAAAHQAPNRAQGFRTYFGGDGIRLVPRTTHRDEAPAWEWRLTLTGWGRDGSLMDAGTPQVSIDGNRIEYRRDNVTEWYVNDARGLEQGFTIDRRPGSDGVPRPLRVELTVGGSLRARCAEDGQAVDFVTPAGARAIRFDHLSVVDARGRELPAHFERRDERNEERLAIVVDDTDALYPIIIDPVATSPSWAAQSNQPDAQMGYSVSTAGDVNGDGFSDVIVGAHRFDNGQYAEGRAFVYHGSTAGLSLTVNWTAESDQEDAWFGYSVATAGDVNGDGFSDVIVGAPLYDNDQTDEGRAFVYHGSASGLPGNGSNWFADGNQTTAVFGGCVAIAGDVNGDGYSDVIVGAYLSDNEQNDEGRAFVYHGSASGLDASANWTAEGEVANALFGLSVSTAGDVNGDGYGDVIVGAPLYTNLLSQQGQVIVYHGSASGLNGFNWVVSGASAGMWFGASVATAGDVNGDGYGDVIVGAPYYDNDQTDEGRAFVYHGSASGLPSNGSNWFADGNQTTALFGGSVATAGDVNGDGYSDVIVGAYLSDNGQNDEGRAFVYHGSTAGLSLTANSTVESDQVLAWFGRSVATAGDVNGDGFSDVIVGAQFMDDGETNEGRAMVYHGAPTGLGPNPNWSAEGDQSSTFGRSVATAGDVNGDGYSDVIVGAPFYDNGQADEGRAFVYHGSASGLAPTAAWNAESDQASAFFGRSVATAGDVNGDGFSDVIVGARQFDNGQIDEGRASVYHGSASGLNASANWSAESDQESANFGTSVATAGDVNGDGYSDVIVGAYWYDNDETDEGRAYVYHGSSGGLALTPAWSTESDQAGALYGFSVGTAGDVNRDGYSDVIVGAPSYSNGQGAEGRAYVYQGSVAGLAVAPAWSAESNQEGALFGFAVATAGDVDGSGYSDVIVGAYSYDNGEADEGAAFVYRGSAAGLALTSSWSAESDQASAYFGHSVATAGDVNGDGFSDVIVGAPNYDNGQTDEGRAYVYHGSAAGLAPAPWSVEGDQTNAHFGISAATAGDINGDGYADVIVGAPNYVGTLNNRGRASVYYGNGGAGFPFLPRQTRTDNAAPIALLGTSDSPSAFQVKATGRTGAGKLRLQFEVKPAGIPFNGTGLVTGPRITPAQAGTVELSALASGLDAGSLYHWRLRILSDSPFEPASRWLSPSGNAPSESDVRTAGGVTAVGETGKRLLPVRLGGVSPNPSRSATDITFSLPEAGPHRLAVHDVTGREVAVLASGIAEVGSHHLRWDGRDGEGRTLPSGVYLVRLEYGGRFESRKLALTR